MHVFDLYGIYLYFESKYKINYFYKLKYLVHRQIASAGHLVFKMINDLPTSEVTLGKNSLRCHIANSRFNAAMSTNSR